MNPVDFSPLLNFLGYGDLGADLWVLGAAEKDGQRHQNPGLSEPERLQDELRVRSTWRPVMDLKEASDTIGERYWEPEFLNYSLYGLAAQLALGMLGVGEEWTHRDPCREYALDRLGRRGARTLLGHILPLPPRPSRMWPYGALYPDQSAYEAEQRPLRCKKWRELLTEHQPAFLVCHDRGRRRDPWHPFRELLGWTEPLSPDDRWTAATVGPTRVYLMQYLGFGKTSKADIEEVVVDARRWREMNEG